jgi:uncharacterized Zn finger protein
MEAAEGKKKRLYIQCFKCGTNNWYFSLALPGIEDRVDLNCKSCGYFWSTQRMWKTEDGSYCKLHHESSGTVYYENG